MSNICFYELFSQLNYWTVPHQLMEICFLGVIFDQTSAPWKCWKCQAAWVVFVEKELLLYIWKKQEQKKTKKKNRTCPWQELLLDSYYLSRLIRLFFFPVGPNVNWFVENTAKCFGSVHNHKQMRSTYWPFNIPVIFWLFSKPGSVTVLIKVEAMSCVSFRF